MHPYSSTDTATAWKKLCFILLGRSDFQMTHNLPIAVHSFSMHMLISLVMSAFNIYIYIYSASNFSQIIQCQILFIDIIYI